MFGYQLESPQGPAPALRLADLSGTRGYRVRATDLRADAPLIDEVRSGDSLATEGLAWPLDQPCTAVIWELDADPGAPAPGRP